MRWRVCSVAVAVAFGLGLAGCGGGGGLPAASGGAIGSLHRSGTAPMLVVTAGQQTLAVVRMTLNGKGPFAFIVDSGASTSVVDTKVAKLVGLHINGKRRQIAGVGCRTTAAEATVSSWKVGTVALPADQVSVVSMGGLSAGGTLGGLLGSDVLSRFGEVALDYRAQELRLGSGAVTLRLANAAKVPVDVVDRQGAVLALAAVRLDGHGPYRFVVDTGAAESTVTTPVASKLHLKVLSSNHPASGVACSTTTSTVRINRWRLGSVRLPGTELGSLKLPAADTSNGQGLQGLLGSNTLSRFGTVVIDYAGKKLFLGPR